MSDTNQPTKAYIRRGRPRYRGEEEGWYLPNDYRIGIYVPGVDANMVKETLNECFDYSLHFTYYEQPTAGKRIFKADLAARKGDYALDLSMEHYGEVLNCLRQHADVEVTNFWGDTEVCHTGCRTAESKKCVCPCAGKNHRRGLDWVDPDGKDEAKVFGHGQRVSATGAIVETCVHFQTYTYKRLQQAQEAA